MSDSNSFGLNGLIRNFPWEQSKCRQNPYSGVSLQCSLAVNTVSSVRFPLVKDDKWPVSPFRQQGSHHFISIRLRLFTLTWIWILFFILRGKKPFFYLDQELFFFFLNWILSRDPVLSGANSTKWRILSATLFQNCWVFDRFHVTDISCHHFDAEPNLGSSSKLFLLHA